MARLALHCEACDTELPQDCPTCQQRHHDEVAEQQAHEARVTQEAQGHFRSQTPGVQALEEHLNLDVSLDCGPDFDGTLYRASLFLLGLAIEGTSTEDFPHALTDLRRRVAVELRSLADLIEMETD